MTGGSQKTYDDFFCRVSLLALVTGVAVVISAAQSGTGAFESTGLAVASIVAVRAAGDVLARSV